jgi:hypothetical protein
MSSTSVVINSNQTHTAHISQLNLSNSNKIPLFQFIDEQVKKGGQIMAFIVASGGLSSRDDNVIPSEDNNGSTNRYFLSRR